MNFDQFIKQAKQVKLSVDEKTSMRRSVLNFISQNPVKPGIYPRLTHGHSILLTRFNFISATAALLIFLALVGGGVSIGAEKALPGDVLYSVKIGVNEEVKGWFTVSEESKANWEIERVQRRLEEAETLAEDGSLDVEAREKIEANFEEHAERVKNRIEKFENKENFKAAADVSSKFETSLKAHHRILNRLTIETEDEVKKEVKSIEAKVRSEAKALIKTGKKIELKSGGKVYGDPESVFRDSEKDGYEDYIGPPRTQEDDLEFENEAEIELENNLELNLDNGTIRSQGRLKANLGL